MAAGQILGYARVSAAEQNEARQVDAIQKFAEKEYAGLHKLYIEKASGKSLQRPEFIELDHYARSGDTIIIHSPDRLARSVKDLVNQLDDWRERDISVRFITQPEFDQRDATSNLTLQILAAVAEFERKLILERQREGIESAKQRGVYKETRKLNPEQVAEIRTRHADGVKRGRLAEDYGVSGSTIYNVIRYRGIYGSDEYQTNTKAESQQSCASGVGTQLRGDGDADMEASQSSP